MIMEVLKSELCQYAIRFIHMYIYRDIAYIWLYSGKYLDYRQNCSLMNILDLVAVSRLLIILHGWLTEYTNKLYNDIYSYEGTGTAGLIFQVRAKQSKFFYLFQNFLGKNMVVEMSLSLNNWKVYDDLFKCSHSSVLF